jgi:hypothetical protein
MALEVEGKGLEDGGIMWIKGDGVFGLSDSHVVEPARHLHGCGVCVGEELGSLCEVPARLARGGATDSVREVEQQGGTMGDGVRRNEHAVARRKRRLYADNDHGGGTLEFEQMTD